MRRAKSRNHLSGGYISPLSLFRFQASFRGLFIAFASVVAVLFILPQQLPQAQDDWADDNYIADTSSDPYAGTSGAYGDIDSDGDTYTDSEELQHGTDPYDSDSFPDLMLPGAPTSDDYGSSPTDTYSSDEEWMYLDSDNDGYTDIDEENIGTDPLDSISSPGNPPMDYPMMGDPNDPGSWDVSTMGAFPDGGYDSDGDGLSDAYEEERSNFEWVPYMEWNEEFGIEVESADGEIVITGLDPYNPDSDGDGLNDGLELLTLGPLLDVLGSQETFDPTNPDDGLGDWDGDGLSNATEVLIGTNLFDVDSDGDQYSDYEEAVIGTNPNDPNDPGEGEEEETSSNIINTEASANIQEPIDIQSDTEPLVDDLLQAPYSFVHSEQNYLNHSTDYSQFGFSIAENEENENSSQDSDNRLTEEELAILHSKVHHNPDALIENKIPFFEIKYNIVHVVTKDGDYGDGSHWIHFGQKGKEIFRGKQLIDRGTGSQSADSLLGDGSNSYPPLFVSQKNPQNHLTGTRFVTKADPVGRWLEIDDGIYTYVKFHDPRSTEKQKLSYLAVTRNVSSWVVSNIETVTFDDGDEYSITPNANEAKALLPVDLRQVYFEGDNMKQGQFIPITSDGSESPREKLYGNWVDEDGDLKPTNKQLGEKNQSIAYVRGTKPKLAAAVRVQGLPENSVIEIRGKGNDGIEIPATKAVKSVPGDPEVYKAGEDRYYIPLTESKKAWPNKVKFYDRSDDAKAFTMTWEIRIDGGNWAEIGKSRHQIYVTFGIPKTVSPLTWFESCFYLGCKNADGKDDIDTIREACYGEFTDRVVERVDGTQMTYWKNGARGAYSGGAMLQSKDGNGNCNAWSDLFRDILLIQGIDANTVKITSPNGTTGLMVKSWTFKEPGSGDSEFPYLDYKDNSVVDVTDDNGIAGQGNGNPPGAFDSHFIVKSGSKYFDPSYGIDATATTEDHEETAFDGFRVMSNDGKYWRCKKNPEGLDAEYLDK